ncbi:PQQ-binding-like beta-propeller repeat protein [Metallosphaera javensis (ex Sakai et al. 2022)]|uniref:PQQ-binding-like beta-propeller repeat protein n=1 Tax=Metallosphaera javensis (ex Sakai et al. 2022) TaxID=2775498 RepID=UPI002582C4B4
MIVINNILYVSKPDSGGITAINGLNGSTLFSAYVNGVSGTSYPAYGEGLIFAENYEVGFFRTTVDLVADNAYNGGQVWSISITPAPAESAYYSYGLVTYYDGYVFEVPYQLNQITSYVAGTGSTDWTDHTNFSITTIPTVGDGLVVVAGGNKVSAINISSGITQWSLNITGNITSTPSYSSGTFFLGTSSGYLYAISVAGTVLWKVNLGFPIEDTASLANGFIYVGTDGGNIYELTQSRGNIMWTYSVQGAVIASPVVSSNGIVYVGSTNGIIYALNATNGKPVWEKNLGASITANPVLVNVALFGTYLRLNSFLVSPTSR